MADQVFVASLRDVFIDGGGGFDTLRFDGLQVLSNSIYNSDSGSGGRFVVYDFAAGSGGLIDFRNIESIVGSFYGDRLTTNAQISSLYGERGDDTLTAQIDTPISVLLRGGEGADSLGGGDLHDDLNGNKGADTLHGWEDGDWVLGGQDGDLLFGDAGDDLLHGNLGADTVDGGEGADTVRGGQGDDVLQGGAGPDLLFGDRGADTVYGGAGADVFHVEIGMGTDVIADFSAAEGDRVQVDGDVTVSAFQDGANVVIRLTWGIVGEPATSEFVVQNTQLSALPSGWWLLH